MKIGKIVNKIQSILDEYYPSAHFDVRSPSSPKVNRMTEGYPILVSGGQGDFEAYPDILLRNPEFQVQILVPADEEDIAYHAHEVLSEHMVGKFLWYDDGEGAISNLSNIVPNNIGLLDTDTRGQFAKAINAIFDRTVKEVEYYMSFDFNVYITTAKNAGGVTENDGGLLFGNQVSHSITVYIGSDSYTEEYSNLKGEHSSATAMYEQQAVNGKAQAATEQTTAYAKSISMLVRNTEFMRNLLETYSEGNIQGTRCVLSESIALGGGLDPIPISSADGLAIESLLLNEMPGEPLSISLTIVPATEVGTP